MFETFETLEQKYVDLAHQMSDPAVLADQPLWRKLLAEYHALEPVVETFRAYRRALAEAAEARELMEEGDPELRAMAREEAAEAARRAEALERELRVQLLPKDANDEKNVIMEIRGGAGGDEAALFAADLFRMYSHYAESRGWKVEVLSLGESDLGGMKEVAFSVSGSGVFARMKFESGVHRVQRVPVTESGGRIHTSTVTVAVLPEADEVDVHIDRNDLRIDVYRSSGNGGQSVNTTDSAVRVTHLPTGLVVTCQDEKSQLKNKDKALRVLYARLYAIEQEKAAQSISAERKSQVGTGDRSERIRTYNFPQSRVTDHRIGLTVYRLADVLNGDLDLVLEPLIAQSQAEALARLDEGR